MKILVINSGSSSLKYQLIDMTQESVVCKGLCERIGMADSSVTHSAGSTEIAINIPLPSHAEAFSVMLDQMIHGDGAVVADKSEICAVGHRVAHGGETFTGSTRIDDSSLAAIDALSPLAPLHNPPQVEGIRSAQAVFGLSVPQIAVFDTAFHQTMPPEAYIYPVPYEFYEDHGLRRYGFHGTSHRYVSERAAHLLGKPVDQLKSVTCHLGNGSSITAVDCGKSVDTSMGFTPLGGLIMGTRSGNLDPSVVGYLADNVDRQGVEMGELLNTKSGFLGVSGISSDARDIEKAADEGSERAQLTLGILVHQIRKYIGAYAAAMNGLDCIVFTGGIGENGVRVRSDVCRHLAFLGVQLDEEKNQTRRVEMDLSAEDAPVRVLLIPTNEELMIARDTYRIVNTSSSPV